MNISRLEKIRRLAEDDRGDPQTRAVAQAKLRELRLGPQPQSRPIPDVDPGLKWSPEYTYHRYMDLSLWGRSKAGNLTHILARGGKAYRVVLFKSRNDTWSWMLLDARNEKHTFSRYKHRTLVEAQIDAWANLPPN